MASPRYCGDEFHQTDATTFPLDGFDLICASPPCQGYSRARFTPGARHKTYPMLLDPIRDRLRRSGVRYVIENVEGAPMVDPLMLCGTMFGLPLRRHRLFESNVPLSAPCGCRHGTADFGVYANRVTRLGTRGVAYIAGSGRTHYRPLTAPFIDGCNAMGIHWMSRDELSEAIPPVYSEWIGTQVAADIRQIRGVA